MKYFLHWRVSVMLLMLACGIQIDDGRYIRRTRMAMLHELFVYIVDNIRYAYTYGHSDAL
jgi:hypothetical protein